MAQNKLENQIKEKLNSREIQPSVQAWDRLDAMLTVAEEKKTKRSPFLTSRFIGIAAAVLVFVSAGMFFFSHENTEINNQDGVVDTEIKQDSTEKTQDVIQIPSNNEAVATSENNQSSINNQPNQSQRVSINQNQSKSIKHNQSNAQNNPLINREKQIEYQNSSDVAVKELPKTTEKKEIVINDAKKTSIQSDEDLIAGLGKIAGQSPDGKASVKIDARSLLSQVDGELEMTFREKVINKVSKNYKEVKTALANRNHE